MKPKLIGEAELEALYDEENKGRCCVVREDFLTGARAALEKLNIQAVTEIIFSEGNCTRCDHWDRDNGCELCLAFPETGSLLVRCHRTRLGNPGVGHR